MGGRDGVNRIKIENGLLQRKPGKPNHKIKQQQTQSNIELNVPLGPGAFLRQTKIADTHSKRKAISSKETQREVGREMLLSLYAGGEPARDGHEQVLLLSCSRPLPISNAPLHLETF